MSAEHNLILPISSCRANAQAIQDTIDVPCAQEPQALMERLNELCSLLATSAQTVASYQHHVETEMFTAIQEAHRQEYAPSMAKVFAEGRCAEIRAEMKLSERQNAAIVHQIDSVRSILSFTKQELYHANTQVG